MVAKIESPEPSESEVTDEGDATATEPVVEPQVVTETPAQVESTPSVPEPTPADPETHHHVAMRDFAVRFAHQVLHFKAGEVIEARIGRALRSTGSPIKLVEKSIEETQGEL